MNNQNLSQREQLQQKYNASRLNLLLMVGLTVVNIVFFLTGSETMLLFSASIPYYAVIFGEAFPIPALSIGCYVIAGLCLGAYFLCWLLSKKRYGWLIFALVLFILDTLAMGALYLWAGDFSGILDVVIHALVLYNLIVGISIGRKLKTLPAEEDAPVTTTEAQTLPNSVPLRRIGDEEKVRVLLEEAYGTYHISYRRVKRLNQLVINNYIYDEVEYLIEPPHSLSAVLDGNQIEVGYDSVNSYLKVNGKYIKKKIRWY
jgi:hypothetical protein